MGQRARILTEMFGYRGWKVREAFYELEGKRVEPVGPWPLPREARVVLRVTPCWLPVCGDCGARCARMNEQLSPRRWADLSVTTHPLSIEAAPVRVKCARCGGRGVQMLPWADRHQRQTRRLQHRLALECASMPVMHVAAMHGLDWKTVRRAEEAALARWDATRDRASPKLVGVDEKWLGRRHKSEHRYVTIVSDLETGEPLWIGYGRDEATLTKWLKTLSDAQKAAIRLFAIDMHRPYRNAIEADPVLARTPIVHDPFHVTKRVGEAVTQIRKDVFFRAGPEMRAIGRGTRWLVLKAWERTTDAEKQRLRELLGQNRLLARAYQIKEEFREVLRAPDRASMQLGLERALRRTQNRRHHHLRKLHDSLREHRERILALGEHRPPTGRIEALNNNWETLVRRARGYRRHDCLLLKLRFMTANPLRASRDVKRFLALDISAPVRAAA